MNLALNEYDFLNWLKSKSFCLYCNEHIYIEHDRVSKLSYITMRDPSPPIYIMRSVREGTYENYLAAKCNCFVEYYILEYDKLCKMYNVTLTELTKKIKNGYLFVRGNNENHYYMVTDFDSNIISEGACNKEKTMYESFRKVSKMLCLI